MNTMYDQRADAKVKCGPITGPVPLTAGDQPYVVVTVSCPFTARYVAPEERPLTTRDVELATLSYDTGPNTEDHLRHPPGHGHHARGAAN